MNRPTKSLCVNDGRPLRDSWTQADVALQQRMLRPVPDRPRCAICSEYLQKVLREGERCPHCGA
jgi:hypothetical protein